MITETLREIFAEKQPWEIGIVLSGFTNGRTTLLEDLTEAEAQKLLQIYCPEPADIDAEFDALKEQMLKKEWRSKILANAEKAGVKEPGSFHKFNNWMLASGKFHKQLTAHSLPELKELYQQIRALMQNNARSAKKPMTKAWTEKAINLKQWN